MNLPADPRAAADQAIAGRPTGCQCSFRIFMVGDGCQYCNPGYAQRDQFPDDYKPVPDAPVPMEDEDANQI